MESQTKCPVCDYYVRIGNCEILECNHKYHFRCMVYMDRLLSYEDSKSLHFSSKDCLLCRPDWETYKKTFVSIKESSPFKPNRIGPLENNFTRIMSYVDDFCERLKPHTMLIVLFIYTLIMLFAFLF